MDKGIVSPLNEQEYEILANEFSVPKTGMIRWRSFVDCVDKGY